MTPKCLSRRWYVFRLFIKMNKGVKNVSPMQCLKCGLLDEDHLGNKQCLALKRNLKSENLSRNWDCYYYISIIKENGEQLTSFEHYLLKLDEIEKKKVSVISMALA